MPQQVCEEIGSKGRREGLWNVCPSCGARIKVFSARDRLPVHFKGEVAR